MELEATTDEALLSEIKGDERQRVWKFRRLFDNSVRAGEEWRGQAIESFEFVSGKQWSDGDIEARGERPSLVINLILGRVLFLAGVQRQTRDEPEILPSEGGDVQTATIMRALYKHVATRTRERSVDSAVFVDKAITGIGYWHVGVDFERDPEGAIFIERLNPLSVFPDPNWLDAGWENAEYCIVAEWMSLEQCMREYPRHKDEIRARYGEWLSESVSSSMRGDANMGEFAGDSFASERLFWDPETQRARILTVWYVERVVVEVAVLEDGEETDVTADEERVAFLRDQVRAQPELEEQIKFVKRPVRKVRCAKLLDDILLYDDPTPFDCQEIPVFPTLGYYWWKTPFGIVEPSKDPQREKNARKSTIVEMLQRAALAGWFNKKDTGADSDDMEKYLAGVGKVINYQQDMPVPIPPPEMPQALIFLEAQSEKDIQTVTNINAELLGSSTQRTVSGKAIRARQQGALIVQEPLLESFAQDREPMVRFVLTLIQQYMSMGKALRIIGTAAERNKGQGPEAQLLDQNNFVALREILTGAFDQEYDVVIGVKPWEPSLKQQQWSMISELAEQFAGAIPPDVLVEAATDAGLIDQDKANRILAFVQQQLQQQQIQEAAATMGNAPAPAALPPGLGGPVA